MSLISTLKFHADVWCPVCREQCPINNVKAWSDVCTDEEVQWITVEFQCVNHTVVVSLDMPLSEAEEML